MHLSRIVNPPEETEEPTATSPQRSRGSSIGSAGGASSARGSSAEPEEVEEEESDDMNTPSLSFIVCMEAKEEGKVCYVSPSVYDVIGWEVEQVIGTPAANYCHPDDVADLYRAYQEMISEDKAACLMYHRVPFKDTSKGYQLCSVSITRVGLHLIGACSPATSATKAMHNASTASEIIVITPSAARLAFRRWNVPSAPPMSASSSGQSTSSRETTPEAATTSTTTSSPGVEADELADSFHRLNLTQPSQPDPVKRVAFVINRFSRDVPIIYCTNDDIIPRSLVLGRSFFDFVVQNDEVRVRQAIDAVKAWGVNEGGTPAEGGFAFNRFHMTLKGRDSSGRSETESSRKRRSLHAMAPYSTTESIEASAKRSKGKHRTTSERGINAPVKEVILVDSIFSPQSDGIIVIIRPALQRDGKAWT